MNVSLKPETNPAPEVARENEVPREGLCKSLVEVENLCQVFSGDDVQVAVGQAPD